MSKTWKKWDLGGGGLQGANIALERARARRLTAYLLWLLFPLGAHAWYLGSFKRASGALITSLAIAGLLIGHAPHLALLVCAVLAAWAIADLFWIDRAVTAFNKRLRLRIGLSQGQGPAHEFTGRYVDDALDTYVREKERERAGHGQAASPPTSPTPRPASFAEQEARLRTEAAHKRRAQPPKD